MKREKTTRRPSRARVDERGRGTPGSTRAAIPRLSLDEAIIAILLAAMDANRHVSPAELARAHNIIWSMKRYRRKSGEHVGRLIDAMREVIEGNGAAPVITAAARVIPARLRPAAFAVSADLVLADGKMEAAERRFLNRLAGELAIEQRAAAGILDAMLVKNSA